MRGTVNPGYKSFVEAQAVGRHTFGAVQEVQVLRSKNERDMRLEWRIKIDAMKNIHCPCTSFKG
jgi:hypothetical protein